MKAKIRKMSDESDVSLMGKRQFSEMLQIHIGSTSGRPDPHDAELGIVILQYVQQLATRQRSQRHRRMAMATDGHGWPRMAMGTGQATELAVKILLR